MYKEPIKEIEYKLLSLQSKYLVQMIPLCLKLMRLGGLKIETVLISKDMHVFNLLNSLCIDHVTSFISEDLSLLPT
jgi:hypothetical protein